MNAETPRRGERKETGVAPCHAEVLRSISRRLRDGREVLRCAQDDKGGPPASLLRVSASRRSFFSCLGVLGVLAFISCFDRSTTRTFRDADAAAADEAGVVGAEDA